MRIAFGVASRATFNTTSASNLPMVLESAPTRAGPEYAGFSTSIGDGQWLQSSPPCLCVPGKTSLQAQPCFGKYSDARRSQVVGPPNQCGLQVNRTFLFISFCAT